MNSNQSSKNDKVEIMASTISIKYSLQRYELHPIKGVFHIVFFLVAQGNLKGRKEMQLTNHGRINVEGRNGRESTSLPMLPQNKTY